MQNRAGNYLGLARRAGKLTLGVNAAAAVKKCFLLVADSGVAKNSRKEIEKQQKRLACPLLYMENLGDAVGKSGCKLAAVREEHLAAAIIKELGE